MNIRLMAMLVMMVGVIGSGRFYQEERSDLTMDVMIETIDCPSKTAQAELNIATRCDHDGWRVGYDQEHDWYTVYHVGEPDEVCVRMVSEGFIDQHEKVLNGWYWVVW